MVSVDISKNSVWSQPDFKDRKHEGKRIYKVRGSLL